jgi:hypothetical protein
VFQQVASPNIPPNSVTVVENVSDHSQKRNNFQQSNGGKTKLEWLSVHNIPAGKDLLIVYSRLSRLMEGEGTH